MASFQINENSKLMTSPKFLHVGSGFCPLVGVARGGVLVLFFASGQALDCRCEEVSARPSRGRTSVLVQAVEGTKTSVVVGNKIGRVVRIRDRR